MLGIGWQGVGNKFTHSLSLQLEHFISDLSNETHEHTGAKSTT